jgi:hypothetical protein
MSIRMKKLFLIVAITIVVSSVSFGQTALEIPADKNASLTKTKKVKGWQILGESGCCDVYIDTTTRYSGEASGTIKSKLFSNDIKRQTVYLMQNIKADNYKGKRLRMSAFVKSENVERAALWMRMDGEDMKVFNLDTMDNRPIKGTIDWQKYELVLDVPFETQQIVFGINLKGNGQVWIDDIKFEDTELSVPTTSIKSPAEFEEGSTKRIEQYKATNKEDYEKQLKAFLERNKTASLVPVNLDFEN